MDQQHQRSGSKNDQPPSRIALNYWLARVVQAIVISTICVMAAVADPTNDYLDRDLHVPFDWTFLANVPTDPGISLRAFIAHLPSGSWERVEDDKDQWIYRFKIHDQLTDVTDDYGLQFKPSQDRMAVELCRAVENGSEIEEKLITATFRNALMHALQEKRQPRTPPDVGDRPRLGIRVQTLTPEVRQHIAADVPQHGMLIAAVQPASEGDSLGLVPGMIIVAINDNPVANANQAVPEILSKLAKRQPFRLHVFSNGKFDVIGVPSHAADDHHGRDFCMSAKEHIESAHLSNEVLATFGLTSYTSNVEECEYPLQILHVNAGEVLIAIGNDPEQSICHTCEAKLSAYILTYEDGKLRRKSQFLDFGTAGSWGAPGNISAIEIAGIDGISVESGWFDYGYGVTSLDIYMFRDEKAQSVIEYPKIIIDATNEGAVAADKIVKVNGEWGIDSKTSTLFVNYKVTNSGRVFERKTVWHIVDNKIVLESGSISKELIEAGVSKELVEGQH